MFLEYDVIKAKIDLENSIPKGSIGTILIIYEKGKHYEVEFIDDDKNSLGTIMVKEDEIEAISKEEMALLTPFLFSIDKKYEN